MTRYNHYVMDLEEKRMLELSQINQNISTLKEMLKKDMPQSGKDSIALEIHYLTNDLIPQLKIYDV